MQQEEEEAEKGGRRKKEVEILREAEGKKGGSPVTAVKSPPPTSSLLLLFSHLPPLSPISVRVPRPQPSPDVPLDTPPRDSLSKHCASSAFRSSRKGSRNIDEGHFAGGRTGTSICVSELETPSSSRSHACSSHRSAPDLSISPRSAGIRTHPPPRLWFSHLSRLFRLLPPLPLLFVFLLSCFLSAISICNQNKSSRYYTDTLLPLK